MGNKSNLIENFKILVAACSVLFFMGAFILMGYYELMGADPEYFDSGTENNIKLINTFIKVFGVQINPESIHKISTLHYAVALGAALIVTFFAFIIAGKKPVDDYEVTET